MCSSLAPACMVQAPSVVSVQWHSTLLSACSHEGSLRCPQGQKVIVVSCGAEHSVVATETGQVYAWGWGRYGNVGDGQKVDR
jgi:alpha-tubulin suppressor-like RCC1 family protein